ncbi:Crp/Fnr family transcriptional regulator [Bradyrhizobium sp. OAE829]|uniref:Crp/Fnr family transcriptional regulator n=1 Tax=Bradyrhizobium sp. OAE829 TaxID=2663807 RepID=UPI00178B25A8
MAAENHLPSKLDASALALLKPHMRTITVEHGELLHSSSSDIEFAYFPRSCIVSVLATTEQGATAETSIVGREGMIGSSTIHGITTSFADSVVQVAGEAVRIHAAEVHRVGQASESFRKIVALFDLSLLAQSQQSTACQALHQVENRAARWLLQCRRRLGSNDIRLTQEFFGQMLGVQRTTINLVERTHCRMPVSFKSAEVASPSSTPRDCRTSRATVTLASSAGTRSCWALSTNLLSPAERLRRDCV